MGLRTVKGRLFFFLSFIVLLPFMEYCFHFIESGPLKGQMDQHPDIKFDLKHWWNGTYQKQKELYLNDSFGFRPDFVRMNNQMDFTLFHILNSGDVYASSDNYLIGKAYVNEYAGVTYMGTDVIRQELIKLKLIQDTLQRLGKTFIFTCAPSKADVYPEKIPPITLPRAGKTISNYYTFKRLSDSLNIKQLDFNALFITMKDTSKNAIITKEGCHWSVYGSLLAADTLIKYIERERKIKMPELTIKGMQYSDTARNVDDDYAKPINLIFPVTKEKFCYPVYDFTTDNTRIKPKVIYIGDSYVWVWIYDGFLLNTNTDAEFWNYFSEAWTLDAISGKEPPRDIDDRYWQKKLLETDCIIVVFTPMNFPLFTRKTFFVEKMYDYFYPDKK